MDRLQYCVYNQTSECFLSLGVILCGNIFARLQSMRGKLGQRFDEGAWFNRPTGIHTMGIFSARDLIYLDGAQKVLSVIESFPSFHLAPYRKDAASILALPVRTIQSSQTLPGNQLVICVAEEMEFRLRSISSHGVMESGCVPADSSTLMAKTRLPQGVSHDRRNSRRKSWPRLVAYDAAGGALPIHGIRDISSAGLYLMTKERWPLGARIRMSLQRTDTANDGSDTPITVELRVARWGEDGVGLEFQQADMEEASALVSIDTH
jgi:PilZ domain